MTEEARQALSFMDVFWGNRLCPNATTISAKPGMNEAGRPQEAQRIAASVAREIPGLCCAPAGLQAVKG